MRLALISALLLCPVSSIDAQHAGSPAFLVADLMESPATGLSAELGSIVTMPGGVIYFAADDGRSGIELWRSDGTAAGTWLVSDVSPGQGDGAWQLFATQPDLLFTSTELSPCSHIRLWRSDGSHEGTLAGPLLEGFYSCSDIWQLPLRGVAVGDRLFFTQVSELGQELWVSDGSESGTRMVANIAPGRAASSPTLFTPVGSLLLFTADDGSTGRELWAIPRQALQSRSPGPRRPRGRLER